MAKKAQTVCIDHIRKAVSLRQKIRIFAGLRLTPAWNALKLIVHLLHNSIRLGSGHEAFNQPTHQLQAIELLAPDIALKAHMIA